MFSLPIKVLEISNAEINERCKISAGAVSTISPPEISETPDTQETTPTTTPTTKTTSGQTTTNNVITSDKLDIKSQSAATVLKKNGHGQEANKNNKLSESLTDNVQVADSSDDNNDDDDDMRSPATINKVPMVTKIVQAMNIIIIQMLGAGK